MTRWAWRDEIGIVDGISRLKTLSMDQEKMEAEIETSHGLAVYIGTILAYEANKAPNYVEMQFKPPVVKFKDKWHYITVTIQKHNGKTPHQMRVQAEQERDMLLNAAGPVVALLKNLPSSQMSKHLQETVAMIREKKEARTVA